MVTSSGCQFVQLVPSETASILRGCRGNGPLLRHSIEDRFDLVNWKGKQEATHCLHVCLKTRRPKFDWDDGPVYGKTDLPCTLGTRAKQDGEAVPPESVAISEHAAGHEDSDRYPHRFGDRQRMAQVVPIPVVEGHDHPRATRRNRHVVETRRLPPAGYLLEVGSEVGGTHAELERVLHVLGDAVITENECLTVLHGHDVVIGIHSPICQVGQRPTTAGPSTRIVPILREFPNAPSSGDMPGNPTIDLGRTSH